jgi:hypothetical protein
MTVEALRRTMPNNEYHQWRAYLIWKAAEMKKAQAKAAPKGRRRG